MKAVNVRTVSHKSDGSRIVDVFLVSDTTPAILPTTGEGIEDLIPTDTFAPFSILFVVADVETKIYIANEHGQFVAQ